MEATLGKLNQHLINPKKNLWRDCLYSPICMSRWSLRWWHWLSCLLTTPGFVKTAIFRVCLSCNSDCSCLEWPRELAELSSRLGYRKTVLKLLMSRGCQWQETQEQKSLIQVKHSLRQAFLQTNAHRSALEWNQIPGHNADCKLLLLFDYIYRWISRSPCILWRTFLLAG